MKTKLSNTNGLPMQRAYMYWHAWPSIAGSPPTTAHIPVVTAAPLIYREIQNFRVYFLESRWNSLGDMPTTAHTLASRQPLGRGGAFCCLFHFQALAI